MKLTYAFFGLGLALSMVTSANAQLRPMIYEDITIAASQAEVSSDWTTADGIEAFFAPKATIEPNPGGLYELCFAADAPEGSCGNDDGRILAIQADSMLSFTWAMPPYMPEIHPSLRGGSLRLQGSLCPLPAARSCRSKAEPQRSTDLCSGAPVTALAMRTLHAMQIHRNDVSHSQRGNDAHVLAMIQKCDSCFLNDWVSKIDCPDFALIR